MIVELFTQPKARRVFARAFRPTRRKGANGAVTGTPGEERVVLCGVNWEQYLRLDKELGHDRPAPRLYWFDGQLEIMTTSLQHERLKEWLGSLIEDYLFETGIEAFPHGQATMRLLEEAGAEPDKSWCFEEEKDPRSASLCVRGVGEHRISGHCCGWGTRHKPQYAPRV